jgi:hypothetical protein
MSRTTIGTLIIMAFFAGAAIVALTEERPDMPVTINAPGAGWTNSHEYPPPKDQEIVGCWIYEDRRIYIEAECIDGKWYDDSGVMVFSRQPNKWIGRPEL